LQDCLLTLTCHFARTVSDDVGGKSLSDTSTSAGVKSTVIHTSVNIFEESKRDKPQYFVDKVKDKRRNKNNNLEFLIGWRGFPEPKNDTWESLGHLCTTSLMTVTTVVKQTEGDKYPTSILVLSPVSNMYDKTSGRT
jgi:hypothetical protein